jgi:hypothetical protein
MAHSSVQTWLLVAYTNKSLRNAVLIIDRKNLVKLLQSWALPRQRWIWCAILAIIEAMFLAWAVYKVLQGVRFWEPMPYGSGADKLWLIGAAILVPAWFGVAAAIGFSVTYIFESEAHQSELSKRQRFESAAMAGMLAAQWLAGGFIELVSVALDKSYGMSTAFMAYGAALVSIGVIGSKWYKKCATGFERPSAPANTTAKKPKKKPQADMQSVSA